MFSPIKLWWLILPTYLRRNSLLIVVLTLIYSLAELWSVFVFLFVAKYLIELSATSDNVSVSSSIFALVKSYDPKLVLMGVSITVSVATICRVQIQKFTLDWAYKMGNYLCSDYINKNLSLNFEDSLFYENNNVLATTVNVGYAITNGFFYSLTRLLVAIWQIFILLLTLAFLSPKPLLLIGILITVCYLVIFKYSRKSLSLNSKKLVEKEASLLEVTKNSLNSRRDLIIYDLVSRFSTMIRINLEKLRNIQRENTLISVIPKPIIEGTFLTGLCIYASIFLIKDGTVDIKIAESLIIFVVALQKLLPSAQSIYGAVSEMQSVSTVFFNIINEISKMNIKLLKSKKIENRTENVHSILSLNGNYVYPKSKNVSLRDLNLNIYPRDKILIKGESGSGKSTLADLIMGLIGDNDNLYLNQKFKSIQHFHKIISHVPQFPYFYSGTVIDNITLGKAKSVKDLSNDQLFGIKRILKACVLDDIFANEHDLNLYVSQSNLNLSGGQLQRLSIARALFHQARIYVFDEATSALDQATENKIANNLNEYLKNEIVIYISHSDVFNGFVKKIFEVSQCKVKIKYC